MELHVGDRLAEYTRRMGSAVKLCPNPRCKTPYLRYRGHRCHNCQCSECQISFCFVCLATGREKERSAGHACPDVCTKECGCLPCPQCATGKACEDCQGPSGEGCPVCTLWGHKSPTPAQLSAREGEEAAAVAAFKRKHPTWPGPRRFRSRVEAANLEGAVEVKARTAGNKWHLAVMRGEGGRGAGGSAACPWQRWLGAAQGAAVGGQLQLQQG